MPKKVLVIGAGASGLVSMKCCVEDGLEPVCVERTDYIGGLWNYKDTEVDDGQACVMRSTVINTSKEMMPYSDYPIPSEFPNFMHNTKVMEYFHMYADHFQLKQYIRFKIEVLKVEKNDDFAKTGKWKVQLKDLASNKESTEVYDAVMICTGHHADKHFPTFPGQDEFEGKIVHTHDYKDHRGLEGKRVVVIGIGNSGGDVAVELGRCAKQVFLSTRRGSWVLNRVSDHGNPVDMMGNRRILDYVKNLLPSDWFNSIAEHKLNQRFDHANYGLKPKHRFNAQHPMVNDDLPNRIACGAVIIKSNVRKFTKTGIEFDDGSFEDNIDCVVFGTGYIFGFPFIDKSVIEVKKNKVDLYKYAFPPDLEHSTLCVVGFVQPWGAIMPIAELQCRIATRLFAGKMTLPPKYAMWHDIRLKQREMSERYFDTQRHTIQVDYIPFMDELAELLGCKPSFKKFLMSDPKLALRIMFGPCTPYQFRLVGPGKWDGAKRAIETQWDRVLAPMKTRKTDSDGNEDLGIVFKVLLFIVVLLFFRWLFGF